MNNIQEDIRELRQFINRKLRHYMSNENPLLKGLYEAMDYTVSAGGKRIRPIFCFLVGEILFSSNPPNSGCS